MLKPNDKVALIGCSDCLKNYEAVNKVIYILREKELVPIVSPYLFKKNSLPSEKGKYLNICFRDDEIKAIFDVSGGDLANEVLDYLDYDMIKKHNKPFFGYSDVTCVLNALNKFSETDVYLYQIKNIIYKNYEYFFNFILNDNSSLLNFKYEFLKGDFMEGKVVGGNIRCFLKLAGTKYFPDYYGKILFLESRSGNENRIRAYFAQLKQMGIFSKISGLILGTFTELEKDCSSDKINSIVKLHTPETLPVIKTNEIGHSVDSKMLNIGKLYKIGGKDDKN